MINVVCIDHSRTYLLNLFKYLHELRSDMFLNAECKQLLLSIFRHHVKTKAVLSMKSLFLSVFEMSLCPDVWRIWLDISSYIVSLTLAEKQLCVSMCQERTNTQNSNVLYMKGSKTGWKYFLKSRSSCGVPETHRRYWLVQYILMAPLSMTCRERQKEEQSMLIKLLYYAHCSPESTRFPSRVYSKASKCIQRFQELSQTLIFYVPIPLAPRGADSLSSRAEN